MGPRSRDRGNTVLAVQTCESGCWLQWGRDHVIAEMFGITPIRFAAGRLQWGRDHVIAEMHPSQLQRSFSRLLQWGRDHVIAKMVVPGARPIIAAGFNGAAIT